MKILFYTANGVGLGHLRRASLIAEGIRDRDKRKKIEIILAAMAQSPRFFGRFFDRLIKLDCLSDEIIKNKLGIDKKRALNGYRLARAIKKFKPDLILADFYLTSSFTFDILKYALDKFPAKSIFIWRLSESKKFYDDFNNEKDKLTYFTKIILPHSREELKDLLNPLLFKKIDNDDKFIIGGPLVRKIDKSKLAFCRGKYQISPRDFLLLVSLGGGGELTRGRCDSPGKIIRHFLDIYPELAEQIPNLKTIIVTGPYFKKRDYKIPKQVKVVKFEKNLLELIYLSKLVVSPAGYNLCNELIQARTPAVLIPLTRGDKEQFDRAGFLKEKGVVKVFKNESSNKLLELILEVKNNLNETTLGFKGFGSWQKGNSGIDKIILDLLRK